MVIAAVTHVRTHSVPIFYITRALHILYVLTRPVASNGRRDKRRGYETQRRRRFAPRNFLPRARVMNKLARIRARFDSNAEKRLSARVVPVISRHYRPPNCPRRSFEFRELLSGIFFMRTGKRNNGSVTLFSRQYRWNVKRANSIPAEKRDTVRSGGKGLRRVRWNNCHGKPKCVGHARLNTLGRIVSKRD